MEYESFNVVVTKWGRMSDCEIYMGGTYEQALIIAREYQFQYRAQGVLTSLINLVTKADSSPFDTDNNFAARNGVSIEISGLGMKDFPAHKLVPYVTDGALNYFVFGEGNNVTGRRLLAVAGEESA